MRYNGSLRFGCWHPLICSCSPQVPHGLEQFYEGIQYCEETTVLRSFRKRTPTLARQGGVEGPIPFSLRSLRSIDLNSLGLERFHLGANSCFVLLCMVTETTWSCWALLKNCVEPKAALSISSPSTSGCSGVWPCMVGELYLNQIPSLEMYMLSFAI